ncbi:SMP-30/gluconolactonase/LRE family protein [Parablastomonas sp. CN1-191]|uniref:SMP-30/gluconolactonase/LRE family protein n=1 Tax=Parablastomonas sp. CN1-191 TaxID=3400908 RepID=UPI003BF79512
MMIFLSCLEAAIGLALLVLMYGVMFRRPWIRLVAEPVATSIGARAGIAVALGLAAFFALAAIFVPFLAFFAATLMVAVTATLGLTVRLAKGRLSLLLVISTLGAALGMAALQPLGLKVLLLPKADELPYKPVPSTVIKTYGPGVWFEGVSAGPQGTLYLAANRDLDFTVAKYYRRAQGQVVAREPDGAEHILLTTPRGSTAGVIAIAPDGTLYMTSNGGQPGLWRLTPGGTAAKFARLPRGAWPNGLDFGPDGMLYAADSALGQVWRIDPHTGRSEIALRDRKLAARRLIALAPGANGLHFVGRDMTVTVSDSTEVLRYRLKDDRQFSQPVLIARGVPGDDFAVGPDGSLFITTHPYDTIVRVAPDGHRTTIADHRQQIVGATDATFGRSAHDRSTLYVVTDGGAFTGGPHTRGALVALKPYGTN